MGKRKEEEKEFRKGLAVSGKEKEIKLINIQREKNSQQLKNKAKKKKIKGVLKGLIAATLTLDLVAMGGVTFKIIQEKQEEKKRIHQQQIDKEIEEEIRQRELFEKNRLVREALEEVSSLKTKEEIMAWLKDKYIEDYEERTGDTTLTTADIEIVGTREDVYVDETTGNMITSGKIPYDSDLLQKDGVSYTTKNIPLYKVLVKSISENRRRKFYRKRMYNNAKWKSCAC